MPVFHAGQGQALQELRQIVPRQVALCRADAVVDPRVTERLFRRVVEFPTSCRMASANSRALVRTCRSPASRRRSRAICRASRASPLLRLQAPRWRALEEQGIGAHLPPPGSPAGREPIQAIGCAKPLFVFLPARSPSGRAASSLRPAASSLASVVVSPSSSARFFNAAHRFDLCRTLLCSPRPRSRSGRRLRSWPRRR